MDSMVYLEQSDSKLESIVCFKGFKFCPPPDEPNPGQYKMEFG